MYLLYNIFSHKSTQSFESFIHSVNVSLNCFVESFTGGIPVGAVVACNLDAVGKQVGHIGIYRGIEINYGVSVCKLGDVSVHLDHLICPVILCAELLLVDCLNVFVIYLNLETLDICGNSLGIF